MTGNHKLTEQLDRKVPTVKDLEGIDRAITTIKQKVAVLPTAIPTPMVTVIPGAPGAAGSPGQVVTSPPRVIVVTTPGPSQTVRPSPAPTCKTSVLGTCLVP